MYISNVNTASLSVLNITKLEIPEESEHRLQSKDNLILLYIAKGAAHINYKDEFVEVKKHDILLINPHHAVDLVPIRRLECISLETTGIIFTSSTEIDSDDYLFITSDNNRSVRYYLDMMLFESSQQFRGTDILLRHLIENAMVHILRNKDLSIKVANNQLKHDEIQRVQEYILENYPDKITLDVLSAEVDINKYYLIRLFKQKTGLSPIDYLIHVRLAEAEKLLANTRTPIAEISDMVGFHSPSHFSKTFRESNHMTPSAYRQRARLSQAN